MATSVVVKALNCAVESTPRTVEVNPVTSVAVKAAIAVVIRFLTWLVVSAAIAVLVRPATAVEVNALTCAEPSPTT